jgi:hypothetical protein
MYPKLFDYELRPDRSGVLAWTEATQYSPNTLCVDIVATELAKENLARMLRHELQEPGLPIFVFKPGAKGTLILPGGVIKEAKNTAGTPDARVGETYQDDAVAALTDGDV